MERCRAATGKAAADLVDEATAAPACSCSGSSWIWKAFRRSPRTRASRVRSRSSACSRTARSRTTARTRASPAEPRAGAQLRRLTVASLAERSAVLSYADLMRALELSTIRELEDLLINERRGGRRARAAGPERTPLRSARGDGAGRRAGATRRAHRVARGVAGRRARGARAAKEQAARARGEPSRNAEATDAAVAAMTQKLKAEAEAAGARGGGAEQEDDLGDAMDADDVRSEIGLKAETVTEFIRVGTSLFSQGPPHCQHKVTQKIV